MIIIKLKCELGHYFEGWFKDDSEFKKQLSSEMIECPNCGCSDVLDASSVIINTPSVVNNQEIKMISEQFIDEMSNHIESKFRFVEGNTPTFSINLHNDSIQDEIIDLSEESMSTLLSSLKIAAKDKMH